MGDTIRIIKNTPFQVQVLKDGNIDWFNVGTLAISTLAVLAAVLIPILLKRYEEKKALLNFRLYVKSQFFEIHNLLLPECVTYLNSSGDALDSMIQTPMPCSVMVFGIILKDEFEKEYKLSTDTVKIFGAVKNYEKFLGHAQKIQNAIQGIDTNKLKENILANGERLQSIQLGNLYEILNVMKTYDEEVNQLKEYNNKFTSIFIDPENRFSRSFAGGYEVQNLANDFRIINSLKSQYDAFLSTLKVFAGLSALYFIKSEPKDLTKVEEKYAEVRKDMQNFGL